MHAFMHHSSVVDMATATTLRARFADAVARADVDVLRARGWCVIDDFLDSRDADAFRDELERLSDARRRDGDDDGTTTMETRERRKYVRPNRTKFGATAVFGKPNIYECDMHDEATLGETRRDAAYATMWAFFDASEDGMASAFERMIPEMRLRRGETSRTVKLQVNEGRGACFPWHYDNPGPPSNRALTCILYLNPEWRPGDGGELRVQPFCGVAATIAPRHNRLAVFYSDRMLHRVTPSNARRRYCATVWLDGDFDNSTALTLNAREALDDVEKTAESLARGNAQRALSRAVYADEYEASLVECMGDAPGAREMLEAHYEHCRAVKKNEGLKRLVDALREHRRDVEAREEIAV